METAPKKGNKKQQDSKKGRPSGAGRRKGKFDGFFAHAADKKSRHVLKRNGVAAARAYIKAGHGSNATFHKISKEASRAGIAARAVFQA
ncbi:MAG: hypothetical protein Q8R55_03165 [Candidatus Taylorbacteria bacterium]|nr:hypothetical protein [Candidatus Taylorbacteria bacterium]